VLLEALASGVPVAAYPVPGPLDVIGDAPVGALRENLAEAAGAALRLSPEACRAHALRYSWRNAAAQFLGNLVPVAGAGFVPADDALRTRTAEHAGP
jgi:glycosyltransferase involved in cell wall biosynthesis